MRDIFIDNVCDFGGYNVPSVINGHVRLSFSTRTVLIIKVFQVFQNAIIVRFISNEHFAFRAA